MMVEGLGIAGVHLIRESRHADARGAFTRVADLQVLRGLGMGLDVCQVSYATNPRVGTVRGLHYQVGEHEETKLIWCVSGRALDVLVDVRLDSPTYGQHVRVEIAAEVPTAIFVDRGLAHGYQTLEPDTTLAYLINAPFDAAAARTLRWDDPTVAVPWPLAPGPISQRDAEAPLWPPAS